MHDRSGNLDLSPSDVTAFLACGHLTTPSLALARGEVDKPEVADEQRDLIFRKGLAYERAYLASLRAEGKTVLETEEPRGDYERAARETADTIRAAEHDVIFHPETEDDYPAIVQLVRTVVTDFFRLPPGHPLATEGLGA